ncbi:DoxX family protein [Streptomyces sp. NPDC020298]|uniref:DoxX family protein n=1 Tax=unclassified Streptomyces TaxID=2593676 RepID=UPI00340A04E6
MRPPTERRSDTDARTAFLNSYGADLGILILRLTVGLVLAGHGAQKLFGLFGGPGLAVTGKQLAELGYHPGTFHAGLAGTGELLGGLGLAAGLLTPLAAAAVGVMINAMAVTASHGLWSMDGGLEHPMCIAASALAIAGVGPGRISLDRPFPWHRGTVRTGAFALGAGGLGAAVVLAL